MNLGKYIPDPLELVLRIAIGMTFLGHGIHAVQGNAKWLVYLETVGLTLDWAKDVIEIIGMADLMVAFIVLLKPHKYVVLWAFVWAFSTAVIRPLSGESIWEFVERGANWGAPLALYLVLTQKSKKHKSSDMISKSGTIALCCIMLLTLFGCGNKLAKSNHFSSDFMTSEKRTWIGPDYWSNPMQDWQVEDGELVCLVSKGNRNVHLLTHTLDSIPGDMHMKVNLKVFNTEGGAQSKNWVGFSLGSRGEFKDYRDDAIFGKGLNMGVTTQGNLFIGAILDNPLQKELQERLMEGVELQVQITNGEEGYALRVSLLDQNTGEPLAQVTKNGISADELIGDLVLVSDYPQKKGNKGNDKKSVGFQHWEVSGSKVRANPDHAFGPILFSQYTLSRNTLKLTAQMAPVILNTEKVNLQFRENGQWKTHAQAVIDKDARTASFRIEEWNKVVDTPYRLSYAMDRGERDKEEYYWEGTIRKEPVDKDEVVVAGFTGNDHLGFPNTDIVEQVIYHDPDVLFFSGDQIYEPNGGYGVQRSPHDKATLDYLRKWYMYGWAYRELLKDRPTVSITDDHDVYHGNIWGAGGKSIPKELGQGAKAQDAGGYKMPAAWVKMVERTQTSHLPDPYDPTPVAQGIGVYYTDMVYAGISFAIIEDRKFKSAPSALLPKAQVKNGWAQNKGFDMVNHGDAPNAILLGDRQMKFLDAWSTDWSHQSQMKVLLSQTIFANVATLPKEAMSGAIIPTLRIMHKGEYPPDDRPVSDMDSNGWPQTGRNNAVKTIRKGFAFHLAGDQHLGSTIQYGVEEWNDSGFAFCVPSITNHWPRRWYPSEGGRNREAGAPKYTGENQDGFGNKMTVHAVSNPIYTGREPSKIYDRAAGYGIVRLNKKTRDITMECWPRQADPRKGDSEQFDGWPIVVHQEQHYNPTSTAFLPKVVIEGLNHAVVEVRREDNGEIVYALRLNTNEFVPKVFDPSKKYTLRIGEPDRNEWQTKKHVEVGEGTLVFQF